MQWMNELKWMNWNEWIDLIFQNCSERDSFIRFFCAIELSLQSRAHFADLICQKCSQPLSFLTFSSGNRALATVSCNVSRPHLPKALPMPQYFSMFKCKSSLRYSPVHFLSTTFPDRAAHPRKQRPSFSDHASHFTRINTGFRARECFQTWIYAFPTPDLMLMWLAWWCGWHVDRDDDVVAMMMRKLAMTVARNSQVS